MSNPRAVAAFLHDLVAVGLTWFFAFLLRFNFEIPSEFALVAMYSLLWVLPLYAFFFFVFGLYRGVWRFASLSDLQHICSAVVCGALVIAAIAGLLRLASIPRSVLVIQPILLILLMGGSRFLYRSWKEHRLYGPARIRGQPVVIIGAGEAADSLLRELHRSGLWYAVALISNVPGNAGRRLHGLPVYAPISKIAEVAEQYSVRHVVIAMPNARASERRRAAELAAAAGLVVMSIPSYGDLLSGRVAVTNLRRVELEDLLGRDEVLLDDAGLHELLTDRVVLVTGAGGSIGAELCRQICHFEPSRLVLLDNSEFALYAIDEELERSFSRVQRTCWAADVRDAPWISEILGNERPAVVFHAAAYKHVPLMEGMNGWQAVRTNAFGALTMARACQMAGVEKFVLISTDKAVNPTNIMGASKRLAERLCLAMQIADSGTRFITVRFGNVLGSSGSVIPKFRDQIKLGGPVTVTHPDIVRYFMTIPEAAQLVLQAGLMGRGGEIFVLDMGEPVRIADLARDMIRLSGFTEEDICIEFTGLRPGEKLFEELLADDETTLPTPHPKLRIAKLVDSMSESELLEIETWLSMSVRDTVSVKQGLSRFVTEYSSDLKPIPPISEREA